MNCRILAINIVWLSGLTVSMEAAAPRELQATPVSNKLGLSLNQYAFSWKVESQQGYRILVASDLPKLAAEVGDLWDSGRRDSEESSNIVCGGKAFPDGATVWWKVQTWDESGAAGAFSSPAIIRVSKDTRSVEPRRRSAHQIGEGGLDFVEGRIGKALRFGRGRPGLQSEDYQGLRSRNGTTISAWLRPEKVTDTWQCVYRKEDGDNRRILAIGKEGPFWGLWFGINIAGYKEVGGRIDPAKLADGQWHHVAASYDGSSVRLFLDGVKIGEQTISGNLGSTGTAPAFIGSSGGQREIFEGGIDDVRVYGHGLSEAAVAKLASGEGDEENEGLAGHWKLDGGIDNEVLFAPTPPVKNRVALLGDSLISRMERYGFFETAVTVHWPYHDIAFRNLGWPGDDVFGTARAEFKDGRNTRGWESGPPDGVGFKILLQQVADADASTVIVGYGSGVAFAEAGIPLDRFRAGYARLMGALAAKGATLILLTPPRQEATGSPVPDLNERNRWLGEASSFIIGIGKKHGHLVIDLHGQLSVPETEPITENGVHLNELGYRRLAGLMTRELGLFEGARSLVTIDSERVISSHRGATVGDAVTTGRGIRFDLRSDQLPCYFLPVARKVSIPSAMHDYRLKVDGVDVLEGVAAGWRSGYAVSRGPEFDATEKLRTAIIGKNLQHRRRLRPLNKTYVFLFRAYEMGHLAYEMGDFDRLVTAAEERIARLRIPHTHRYSIERIDPWKPVHDDPEHEVPRFIPAPDIADELSKMEVPEGYQLNLFSADPILTNPINLNWDTRGRAWVSMSSTYPHIKPGTEPNDRIVILEDQDQNGVADKWTVFADGLLVPHSVMPVKGGAYVCSATEFLFLADTDGDDRADDRRVVFSGFGNADVHHMIHALRWAPWGELYFNQSIYINSFIDTRWGKRRLNGSGVWRFRPETERLDVFARGAVNPWGHAIDRWGQSFITDGAGGQGPHYTFPGAAFRSAVGAPRTMPGLVLGKPNGTGCEVLSGRHFPEQWRGSIVENDFRANRTVRYKITETGSGYAAEEVETLVRSSRQTFRPVDLKVGPDGALYIVDWYNAIIDHGEVDFHHPLRDKAHGRIWRLIAKDRPLVERPNIHGAPVEALLEYLKVPEGYSRTQAKRELSTRSHDEVLPKLESWLTSLSTEDPEFEHHRLEALWLYGTMNAPDEKLLRKVLASPEPRARASGVRILFHWRDHVDKPFELFASAINDEHPRVRLEAVNVLREIGSLEAANIAIRALNWQLDQWLDYAIWLTARELRDDWLPALQAGKKVFGGATDQLRYALEATGDPRATEPLVALLRDAKIGEGDLPNAVKTIAGLGRPPEVDLVLTLAGKQPSLLTSIAEGARHNGVKPDGAASVIPRLAHGELPVREAAAELAGIWRVTAAGGALAGRVRNARDASERLIAARALARLKQFDRLAGLAASTQDQDVRVAAVAAWAEAQPVEARRPAVEILVGASDSEEIEPVFTAFINRESGASQLAEALEKFRLKQAVAITGIRLVRGSGREFPKLIVALNKAGALKPVAFDLTQHEREDLLAQVITSGDAKRGAEVYRRKSMACTLCHQIGTEGGKVGPVLSSIGAYAQPAAILDSILSPNNDIKQGFETVIVTRKDDTTVAGILQRRSDAATVIRDPANKIVAIPNDDVKKSAKSPVSLMPAGLTATLRKDELVDLVRYLTGLNGNGDARPLPPQQK